METLSDRPKKEEVRQILLSDHASARGQFESRFGAEIDALADALARVLAGYRDLDKAVGTNRRIATVTAFVYTAANSLITSVQLLLSGMLIPSGNLMRQYAEATAMALLCSSPKLDVFDRFDKSPGTFPVHDSLTLVGRKNARRALDVDKGWWHKFVVFTKFYDDLSHPSVLAVYSQFVSTKPGLLIVGGEFDPGKTQQYRIELQRRHSAARVLALLAEELVRRVPKMTAP